MNQDSSPAAEMAEFFTRQRSNDGVKLDLALPNGLPSPHWLRIRGIDSDAFKTANSRLQRQTMDWAAGHDKEIPEDEVALKLAAGKLELLASLIIDWSFKQECNFENAKTFLREAPQIGDEIDKIATRRRLFFALSSTNSEPSPATSSS